MLRPLTTLLSALAIVTAAPTPPPLTFLYNVKLLMPPTVNIGSVPYGSRGIIPISGGTFTGPKLNGAHLL